MNFCAKCQLNVRGRYCPECLGGTSYKRTPAQKARMSRKTKGKPKLYARGVKRPAVAKKIATAWTDEMRAAARERGLNNAQNPEWRMKVSNFGEENPMWKGGESTTSYAPGFDKTLKKFIRERDDHTCQLCGTTEGETGCAHSIHHVDYDKTNHNHSNLATTCKACNSRVNTNESAWFGYFTALADMRSKLGKDVLKFIGRKIVTQSKGFIRVLHV